MRRLTLNLVATLLFLIFALGGLARLVLFQWPRDRAGAEGLAVAWLYTIALITASVLSCLR